MVPRAPCPYIRANSIHSHTGFAVLRGLIDAIIPGNFPKFAVAVVRLHQNRPRHRSPQAMAFGTCWSSSSPQSGDTEVGGSCDRVFVFDRNCIGALCRQACDPLCKESFTG